MKNNQTLAIQRLHKSFITSYPAEATRLLEKLPPKQVAEILLVFPFSLTITVWERLVPDVACQVLSQLTDRQARELLETLNPSRIASWLAGVNQNECEHYLNLVGNAIADELRLLMAFPSESAGALMDPRVLVFRPEMSVKESLHRLRASKRQDLRSVFVVNDESSLIGTVTVQSLALSEPTARLEDLMIPTTAFVNALASREEVVEVLEEYRLTDLPVVDIDGHLVGVIRPHTLVTAVETEASAKLQTMVGVSKEEKALSHVSFSVRKRLPWLHVNLLTAFIAAAVVGLFENVIAQFTALAVLLPVVAGQSGNTGAQSLAVTMRGLALREVRARHWGRLVFKEAMVGLCNGVVVAAVTALGVWFWSDSLGLAFVICISMVFSMVIASISGATIPIILVLVGQDPAQSSSIFLTTVTDVVGFSSFLGIATLLSHFL